MLKRGDTLGGARQLHRVPDWWPTKGEARFLEAQAFKQVDRAHDAELAWEGLLEADPLHPIAPELFHGSAKELVALYVLEGRLDEARRVLWRAFDEASPVERPGVLITRVRAELERIDHTEAVGKLRAYTRADPDDRDARRALPLELHATGDEAAADLALADCLRVDPDDPVVWRGRLEILRDRGDAEGFRQAVDQVPSTTRGDARVWMYRGLARQAEGDLVAALEAFRKSAELAPHDAEVVYKLGMAEVAGGLEGPGREHLARTRELHQAYAALRDGYHDFLEQSARSPRDGPAYRASMERLATNLRILGWSREADAWLAELGPG